MNTAVDQFRIAVQLLILMAAWPWLWRPTALDCLRDRLFAIRNDLFLEAAEGRFGLSVDDPEYRQQWAKLNRINRFSRTPRLSFLLLIPMRELESAKGDRPADPLKMTGRSIKKRTRMHQVDQAYLSAIIDYLLVTTFWAWPVMAIVAGLVLMIRIWSNGLSALSAMRVDWEVFSQWMGRSIARNINRASAQDLCDSGLIDG